VSLLKLDDQMDEVTIKSYPLAQYAADHFGDHAKSENVVSQMSDDVDRLLDQYQPHFFAWLRMRRALRWGQSPEGVPLYYVCAVGIPWLSTTSDLEASRGCDGHGWWARDSAACSNLIRTRRSFTTFTSALRRCGHHGLQWPDSAASGNV